MALLSVGVLQRCCSERVLVVRARGPLDLGEGVENGPVTRPDGELWAEIELDLRRRRYID